MKSLKRFKILLLIIEIYIGLLKLIQKNLYILFIRLPNIKNPIYIYVFYILLISLNSLQLHYLLFNYFSIIPLIVKIPEVIPIKRIREIKIIVNIFL